ncbi:hypothetical protein [Vagococcus carniphilus]|uniref:oxidoreductase n=1 Tax=Vagococcus carniphilus TaxID=218144 RepID=UPI003B5CDAD7
MRASEPIQLQSGVTLKNRLVFAPISTMEDAPDGKVTKDELSFFAQRTGDVGAIVIASAYVDQEGKSYGNNLSVSHDHYIESLKELPRVIQQNDTKIFLQLYHGGAMAEGQVEHFKPVCVSQTSSRLTEGKEYRELTDSEIEQIILAYKEATLRAIKAGFDGVEIHAANSYLPNQFLMPTWNLREDKWGGSLENRLRFLEVLIDQIKEVVAMNQVKPFALGVRISLEDAFLGTQEERDASFKEALGVLKMLDDKGLDYLHITSSNALEKKEINGQKIELLRLLKRFAEKTPLVGCGNLLQSEEVEEALEFSDLVSACRPFVFTPDWAKKIQQGELIELPSTGIDWQLRQKLNIPRNLWKGIESSPDWYLYKF